MHEVSALLIVVAVLVCSRAGALPGSYFKAVLPEHHEVET